MSGGQMAQASTADSMPRWLGMALIAALSAYAVFIAVNLGVVAGGSDSSGYFNQGRALSRLETHVPMRKIPGLSLEQSPAGYICVPLGTKPSPDNQSLVMTYPIGLPLLFAAASLVVGWDHAGDLALWLHTLAGLFLIHAWNRLAELSRAWSLAGTAIAASSALYIQLGLQAMSDLPALVWVTAAMVAAWRSRPKPAWALAAGGAFAMAVLIRPSNAVAVIPVAIALGFSWRRWVLFGLGGFPGALALGWYNLAAYGEVLVTGYGNVSGSFSWDVVPRTLWHYLLWLPALFSPIVLAAALLPAGGRWRDPRTWINLAWPAAFLGFFASYWHTHETWWYLRFVLPIMPALLAGGLVVIEAWTQKARSRPLARLGMLAGLGAMLAWQVFWVARLNAHAAGRGERIYSEAAEWVSRNLPADAIVVCMQGSGALFFYTDLTISRWDMLTPENRDPVLGAIQASGRPVFAVLWRFENPAALEAVGGDWEHIGMVRDVTIWRQTTPASG